MPKKGESNKIKLICVMCGKEFERAPSHAGKYCSRACNNNSKKNWDENEESKLLAMQEEGKSFDEIAIALSRTKKAIKSRSAKLKGGYRKKWTEEDADVIKKMVMDGVEIPEIAEKLGSTRSGVNWQIHKLGLGAKPGTKELSEKASKRNKKLWNDPNHTFNQPEYRDKLQNAWLDPNSGFNTEEYRQHLSDLANKNKPGLTNTGGGNGRYHGGKREDLGHYVRSGWEANIARYLKMLIAKGEVVKYEYEPDCYEFVKIKRGNRSYTPDFKVFLNNGTFEYWEVKGYMNKDSAVKLKRMAKYYPDIKIVLIEKAQYNEIKKWSRLIPCWE